MRNFRFVLLCVFSLLAAFFCYSLWIAPFSIHHGYYVGAAKLMAQGLIPWKDFNIMDMPLAIGILSVPYRIFGIDCSGNLAVIFSIGVHLLNLFLLSLVLGRLKVKSQMRWVSLLIYHVMLYSSGSMMVQLEPMAVTFMLIALLLSFNKSLSAFLFSVFCLVLGVCCKAEMLFYLPVFCAVQYFQEMDKCNGKKRCYRFFLFFTVLMIVIVCAIACISGNIDFVGHLDLHPVKLEKASLISVGINLVILFCRSSLYFLVLTILYRADCDRKTIYWVWVALLAFVCQGTLCFFMVEKSSAMFLFPFVSIAFGLSFQDLLKRKKWILVLYLSCFVFPGYLVYREYQKLDGGAIKEEQQAYISVMNELVGRQSDISLFAADLSTYDFGPQIYSEVHYARPFQMKTTLWGLENWKERSQTSFVLNSLNDADFIIMDSYFLEFPEYLEGITGQKWNKELQFFLDNRETLSMGDLTVIDNKKYEEKF